MQSSPQMDVALVEELATRTNRSAMVVSIQRSGFRSSLAKAEAQKGRTDVRVFSVNTRKWSRPTEV
jgi:hypothetical protein